MEGRMARPHVGNETSLTAKIVKDAKALGFWTFKIAGGPFQTAGIPDLLCVRGGIAVFLEVKVAPNKPTPLQLRRIEEIKEVGGATATVVYSREEALQILKEVATWNCEK
jgi:Holliday junction resolvase